MNHINNGLCNCKSKRCDNHICNRFICDDRFKVRLGGLQGGLNFRLRQLIDREVIMEVECGGKCEEIEAKICFVGSDFIEVKILDEKEKFVSIEDFEKDVKNDEDCNKKNKTTNEKSKKETDFLILSTENVKSFKFKDNCNCNCLKRHNCKCDCYRHHDHCDYDCMD
jgi:hypothetical protein